MEHDSTNETYFTPKLYHRQYRCLVPLQSVPVLSAIIAIHEKYQTMIHVQGQVQETSEDDGVGKRLSDISCSSYLS